MTRLGSLIEVDLRVAWQNEAQHFTPWLAEHLDELSGKIGIPLELEGIEVPVDSFSADILARNTADETRVLIENQLERTDHTHLGQILTYLAGLDVKTVIWVAPEFREAHLSALRWLNEHTANPFSFFAVRVRVVRINDSLPAPVVEVVEQPNQWDRRIQELAPSQVSEEGQQRKAFWSHFLQRFPDEEPHGKADAANSRWHVLRDYNLVISQYLARDRVGLFIRGTRGADHLDAARILAPHRERLACLAGSAEWDERRGWYFNQSFDCDTPDANHWDEIADWLHDTTVKYANALDTCFGEQR